MNILTRIRDKIFGINKLCYLYNKDVKIIFQSIDFKYREIKALELLKPYLPNDYVLETGYSISFQTIQHVINDLIVYEPEIILEFGSGISTQVINNFITSNQLNTRFISIDDDQVWQNRIKRTCENIEFYCFPLVSNHPMSYQSRGVWFSIPEDHIINSLIFDLVLIDAPKGDICSLSRFGFIPFLSKKLNKNSIIYLDDTNRSDEDLIAKLFIKDTPKKIVEQKCYNYTRFSGEEVYYTKPS
jgi:hypothetical protein